MFDADKTSAVRADLNRQIDLFRGQLSSLRQERDFVYELHKRGHSIDYVGKNLDECEAKIAEVTKAIDDAMERLGREVTAANAYVENADELRKLIERLRGTDGQEVFMQRSLIAARLKAIIECVFVSPASYRPFSGREKEILGTSNFEVRFRNGDCRIVFPNRPSSAICAAGCRQFKST